MTVIRKPPLITSNGIQSDYELLGTGVALVPTESVAPSMFTYDRRRVIGGLLGGMDIVGVADPLAGVFDPRFTKVTSSGLILHVIPMASTMVFHVINSSTTFPIATFEVQGAISGAHDILLSDTHIVYVNKWQSARFSGVYIITFDYEDMSKQHPSVSQRHLSISSSARLSWGDKAHTLAMIMVDGSSSIMCIELNEGKTPQTMFPKLIFPDIDCNLRENSIMLSELSAVYYGAQFDGSDDVFPAINFCHEVTDEVYQSTMSSIKWFNTPSLRKCTFLADGGFIYSLEMVFSDLVIKAAMIDTATHYGLALPLLPLCSMSLKGKGSLFLAINRAQVLHLGGDGPAALFLIDGRCNSKNYLCFIWVTDTGHVTREEYHGEYIQDIRPKKLFLGFADGRASVVMTDKLTYYIKR